MLKNALDPSRVASLNADSCTLHVLANWEDVSTIFEHLEPSKRFSSDDRHVFDRLLYLISQHVVRSEQDGDSHMKIIQLRIVHRILRLLFEFWYSPPPDSTLDGEEFFESDEKFRGMNGSALRFCATLLNNTRARGHLRKCQELTSMQEAFEYVLFKSDLETEVSMMLHAVTVLNVIQKLDESVWERYMGRFLEMHEYSLAHPESGIHIVYGCFLYRLKKKKEKLFNRVHHILGVDADFDGFGDDTFAWCTLGEKMQVTCGFCGKEEENESFSKCARCRVVYYCSRAHQKKDWKTHKLVCQSCD